MEPLTEPLALADQNHQGSERLVYTNTLSVALDSLYFRLLPNGQKSYGNGSLSVSRAAVNAQPVQTSLSVQDTALQVNLPASLPIFGTLIALLHRGKPVLGVAIHWISYGKVNLLPEEGSAGRGPGASLQCLLY